MAEAIRAACADFLAGTVPAELKLFMSSPLRKIDGSETTDRHGPKPPRARRLGGAKGLIHVACTIRP